MKTKKLLATLLALVLLVSCMSITAFADVDTINVDSSKTTWNTDGTYVVNGDVRIIGTVTISANVVLQIAEGSTLTIKGSAGNTQTVSGEAGGNGKNAIEIKTGGTLTVNGAGTLKVIGGEGGFGYDASTMEHGTGTDGGDGGCGIYAESGTTITLTNGTVNVSGGERGEGGEDGYEDSYNLHDDGSYGDAIKTAGALVIDGAALEADSGAVCLNCAALTVSKGAVSTDTREAGTRAQITTATVTGGLFDWEVSNSWVSSGYQCVKNTDSTTNSTYGFMVVKGSVLSSATSGLPNGTTGSVSFAVDGKAATVAEENAVVTATATAVDGYVVALSVVDADQNAVAVTKGSADNIFTFTMPAKAVTVTATYTAGTYLDLDTTTTDIPDSKDIAQTYTLTQSGDTQYTDASKVKVEWTVTNIGATYTGTKTWNPDEMKWVETKDVTADDHTAEFKLTNYSSEKVNASVTFKAEETLEKTLTSATFKNGDTDVTGKTVTLDTPVTKDQDTYADSDFTAKTQTVTATLSFNKDEFAKLSATTAETTYGTYTVKLGAAAKLITFTPVTALANLYNDVNVSILESNIVLSGNTWADVIAANSGNTIKFTYLTYTFDGTLGIDDDGDVVIKAPSTENPDDIMDLLYLTSIDLTGTDDYQISEGTKQYCVKSTATASDTVYFALAGS